MIAEIPGAGAGGATRQARRGVASVQAGLGDRHGRKGTGYALGGGPWHDDDADGPPLHPTGRGGARLDNWRMGACGRGVEWKSAKLTGRRWPGWVGNNVRSESLL